MSFADLLYREAHAYPGKVPALAVRMGKSPVILQNKLNPCCTTNHMTVEDAEMLLDFTNSNLNAAEHFARKGGGVVIRIPQGAASDMELLDEYINVITALGEFSNEFQKDIADGVITQKEFERLTIDSDEVIAKLRERCGQMVKQPGPLKAVA